MSWLSKALGRSKKKGTGIYSWASSSALTTALSAIPGGSAINAGLSGLSESSKKAQARVKSAKAQGKSYVEFNLKDGTKINT